MRERGRFCRFRAPIATFLNASGAEEKDIANGVALSVDLDEADAEAGRKRLEQILGPATVVVASGGERACSHTGELKPKMHLHWRLQEPTREFGDHVRLKEARRIAAELVGADTSCAPPVHPLRWPGSWHRKQTARLAQIVALNEDAEIDLGEALERLREAAAAAGVGGTGADYSSHQSGEPEADPLDVAAALAVTPNHDRPWPEWNRIGMAVWAAAGGSASGLAAFMAWSQKSKKFNEADVREAGVTIGHRRPIGLAPERCSMKRNRRAQAGVNRAT